MDRNKPFPYISHVLLFSPYCGMRILEPENVFVCSSSLNLLISFQTRTEEAASIASPQRNVKDDVAPVMVKQVQKLHRHIQQQQRRSNPASANYPVFPLSPGQGSVAELKSPGWPQSARISPVIGSNANVPAVSPNGRIHQQQHNNAAAATILGNVWKNLDNIFSHIWATLSITEIYQPR